MSPNSYKFSARNDVIVIRGVHDVATDTSAESRRLEGKLDALENLVTQLAANQKPATVARVCSIRSSNDHDTSVCSSTQQSRVDEHPEAFDANTYSRPPQSRDKALDREEGSQCLAQFNAGNDAIVIRGVNGVATDTSAETRKLEGKLDALVNFVTQLAVNQKPASVARQFSARNDAIVIRGVHIVATDASAETRKLEGNLDALLNLVTQLAANLKPASIARDCDILSSKDHHTRVYDVAKDTSAETRKLEDKLDALVNLVTQLYVNQKPASVARVCDIRSSNDHHTSVCPSSQQSGVDEHPEAYSFSARNDAIFIRGVQVVATDTSAKTRKLEGRLEALVNLVTQLAANQKSASLTRVSDIHSSNDHHTSVCTSLQHSRVDEHPRLMPQTPIVRPPQSNRDKALDGEDGPQLLAQFSARNDVIVIKGVHDVATDTSAQTRKLEGKLDALVNLVTQLSMNQKPASVARVFGIHSSNHHHTRVCPSSKQSRVDEYREAYAFNARNDAIVIIGVHGVATDTSSKTRKLEGKLDSILNLVTQLVANHKPAFIARGCGIRSSNDHHTSVCTSSQHSGVDEHPEDCAANTYNRPP
ncbi:hypothetical protein Fmac_015331 [Flemingia macrophylla]|uniref:Uncharacterized protein n=1 Tax=Flemingia macrophylla TaxID=520843 RepID=A0ABD1MEA3_9FABA